MPVNGQPVSLFFLLLLLAIIILTPPISLFEASSWHWWGSIESMEKKKKKHGRLSAVCISHWRIRRSPIHNARVVVSLFIVWRRNLGEIRDPPLPFYNDFISTRYTLCYNIQDRCGIGIIASFFFIGDVIDKRATTPELSALSCYKLKAKLTRTVLLMDA